jgi:hypothetical protein
MKIKARIADIDRKYYGTEIVLTSEEGRTAYFTVWVNSISDYTPSEREIDHVGEDGKFYYYEDDGELFEYEICDDHYETQTAYNICKVIVEALNNAEV